MVSGKKWIRQSDGKAVKYRPALRGGSPSGGGKTVAITYSTRKDGTGDLECLECGVFLQSLTSHLERVHDMTVTEYRAQHGNVPIEDEAARAARLSGLAVAMNRRYQKLSLCRCEHCGKEFRRKRRARKRRFCSKPCRDAAARERRVGRYKQCKTCGQPFYVAPCNDSQTYCSKRCCPGNPVNIARLKKMAARAHQESVERHTKICEQCGATFVAARLEARVCSAACRNAFYEMGWRPKTETRSCAHCGDTFETQPARPKKYCSLACAHAEAAESGVKDERVKKMQRGARKRATRLRRASAKTCQACGEVFYSKPSRRQIYCSSACYNSARARKKSTP